MKEMWDTVKGYNRPVIEVPEEKERELEHNKYLKRQSLKTF